MIKKWQYANEFECSYTCVYYSIFVIRCWNYFSIEMDFQSFQCNCCFLWQWLIPQSNVVLFSHTGSPSRGGAHACTLWKRHRDRACAAWFRAQEGCIWHGSTNQESPVWPCLWPPGTTLSHEVQDFYQKTICLLVLMNNLFCNQFITCNSDLMKMSHWCNSIPGCYESITICCRYQNSCTKFCSNNSLEVINDGGWEQNKTLIMIRIE